MDEKRQTGQGVYVLATWRRMSQHCNPRQRFRHCFQSKDTAQIDEKETERSALLDDAPQLIFLKRIHGNRMRLKLGMQCEVGGCAEEGRGALLTLSGWVMSTAVIAYTWKTPVVAQNRQVVCSKICFRHYFEKSSKSREIGF
jgi:hypothetical protein